MSKIANEHIINGVPQLKFSEAEEKAIFEAARKKVLQELKQEAADKLQATYESQIRQNLLPEEHVEPILIDLAPHAATIVIDGVIYEHGQVYELPARVRATMNEIMARTWKHEAEIGGANSNYYRAPANARVTPKGVTTTHGIMRM